MTVRYAAQFSNGCYVGKRSYMGRETKSGACRKVCVDLGFAELWGRKQDAYEQGEVVEVVVMPMATAKHLQRCTEYLGYLEDAGVANWSGMEHVSDLAREAGYFDEDDE